MHSPLIVTTAWINFFMVMFRHLVKVREKLWFWLNVNEKSYVMAIILLFPKPNHRQGSGCKPWILVSQSCTAPPVRCINVVFHSLKEPLSLNIIQALITFASSLNYENNLVTFKHNSRRQFSGHTAAGRWSRCMAFLGLEVAVCCTVCKAHWGKCVTVQIKLT